MAFQRAKVIRTRFTTPHFCFTYFHAVTSSFFSIHSVMLGVFPFCLFLLFSSVCLQMGHTHSPKQDVFAKKDS